MIFSPLANLTWKSSILLVPGFGLPLSYCWSGVYLLFEFFGIPPLVRWEDAEDYAHHSYDSKWDWFYHPTFRYDYYICKMIPVNPATKEMDESLGWVEVWFFTGEYYTNGDYDPPSAYVYDSEGNFYEVDLTIE